MSRKEVVRPGLVKALVAGQLTNRQVAAALRLSVRQVQRLKRRFEAAGVAGLVHRTRGQPSRRRLAPAVRQRVADLMRTVYAGLNDCHLTEKLREVEGLTLCRESVRGIRRALGLPAKHPRRPPRHRRRRLAEARAGSLVLLDGSPAAWLEARGPAMTLHGALDDATGEVLALHFRPTEDLHGYAVVFDQVFTTRGLPVACYGDGTNILIRTDPHWTLAEELRGAQDPTHLGRVLADLGIGYIRARSPQAKGRIERLWGTLQDRLVSELRLRGIATREAANAFLPLFLADYNRALRAPAGGPHARVAAPAARPRAARELPLHAHRRPRQHRSPRPPVAATPPRPRRPLVCGPAPRTPGVRRRPPGRARGGAAARRAALARGRLRAPAPRRLGGPAATTSPGLPYPVPGGGPRSPP